MATCISNTYEAARNQQVELNKKKFEVFLYQPFISVAFFPRFLIFFDAFTLLPLIIIENIALKF